MNTCRSWHCLHSNVRRSTRCALIGWISLIEVSPPHAGHSATAPRGGRSRGMHVVSSRFGGLCVSLESTSAARTPYGVSIVLQPGRIGRSSLCNMEHFSNNKTRPSTGFLMPLDPEFFRNTTRLAREREVLECPSEQNWRDAGNDHFCSALGTCRRGFFGWHFFASHVISFHARLLGASLIGEGSPIRRGLRTE
jgi:hypothetical protein